MGRGGGSGNDFFNLTGVDLTVISDHIAPQLHEGVASISLFSIVGNYWFLVVGFLEVVFWVLLLLPPLLLPPTTDYTWRNRCFTAAEAQDLRVCPWGGRCRRAGLRGKKPVVHPLSTDKHVQSQDHCSRSQTTCSKWTSDEDVVVVEKCKCAGGSCQDGVFEALASAQERITITLAALTPE